MAESAHPLVLRAREALARSEIRSAEVAVEERLKTAVIGINARADWAYNELIELLMTHGKVADAEQVARAALRANPGNAQAHNVFGLLLSNLNDLPAGEWHFRRAVELAPSQAALATNLANNLVRQGRMAEAEGYLAQALKLAPDDPKTLAAWSAWCESRGDLARANEFLDRAAAASSAAEVGLQRARLLTRAGRYEEALTLVDGVKELTGETQLGRGKILEQLGRHEEAWQEFVAAKRKLAAEAGGLQYKADAVEALYGRFKQFFIRENNERLPRAKLRPDVPQPVFIMGLPRSGTTLVEGIVARHSKVTAGGELAFLGELRKVASDLLPAPQPFPENLAQSWTADRHYAATLFRDYYLARAENYGLFASGKPFFTDKMPFNEIYLPLLKMAFPAAKIVHVMRHPLDVCVSTLSNSVTLGFNSGYRLEDTAHHLAAVFDLFQHYRREWDLGDYVLQYEALVNDPVGQTRKLLDYLGLPVEEACLRTQINDGSINRHSHYKQYLRPCMTRLHEMMAAYGYE